MSEENKVGAKRGPKPKVKRTVTRENRVLMQGDSNNAIPDEAKDPNFYYRWCADYGKGKIRKYEGAMYEYVLDDNGNKIIRPGGEPLYLMKLPKDLRDQDQLVKRNRIIDNNRKMQRDNAPKKGVEYLPEGYTNDI